MSQTQTASNPSPVVVNSKFFGGNTRLKAANVQIAYTKANIEEYIKCSKDPIYFAENYGKIVTLDGGITSLVLYDFQKEIMRAYHNNRFVISCIARQSGKSTVTLFYVLWCVLFKPNYRVAFLANKEKTAKELLARLQLAYEFLPFWLQQGVVEWNKFSIMFENGSKLLVAATSSSSARGDTFNCIAGDAMVEMTYDNMPFAISLERFYEIVANSSRTLNISDETEILTLGDLDERIFTEQILHHIHQTYGSSRRARRTWFGAKNSGATPQNTEMYEWYQRGDEYSNSDYKGTSVSTQAIGANGASWACAREASFCSYSDADWQARIAGASNRIGNLANKVDHLDPYERENDWAYEDAGNPRENVSLTQGYWVRAKGVGRDKGEATRSMGAKSSSLLRRLGVGNRTKREDIGQLDWAKENARTRGEDQSESRKDTQDSREASRYDTKPRITGSNESGRKGSRALEQRLKIKTRHGYKSFRGITRSLQETVTISCGTNTIRCTPDHKIETTNGFIEAAAANSMVGLTETGKHSICVSHTADTEYVYDILHVEDVHSFIANGISVSNCIVLDEFAFVPTHIAEEFYASIYPTISTGKESKLLIVSTPNGLNHFYKMWSNAVNKKSQFVPIHVPWDKVPGRDAKWKEETIANTSEQQFAQEFSCVHGDTVVEIEDTSGVQRSITIKELYDELTFLST